MAQRFLKTGESGIDSDSLCTPPEILIPMRELFGGRPGCDPCSNPHSIVGADITYTMGGLHRPWGKERKAAKKRTAYMNQPYSTNDPWVVKAIHEMDEAKRVDELLVLCMFAASTVWWRKLMILPRRNPRVMATRRIRFLGPGQVPMENTAQFDTALIYYGTKTKKFDQLFKHQEMWTTWGR